MCCCTKLHMWKFQKFATWKPVCFSKSDNGGCVYRADGCRDDSACTFAVHYLYLDAKHTVTQDTEVVVKYHCSTG